ncbi:Peptide-N(4)-(N-acetyl-beta-glucosaminyl)asparagine amidase [Pleurotus pulmonarius]
MKVGRQLLAPFVLPFAFAWAPKQAPAAFRHPQSDSVDYINPLIGNGGDTPNGSGDATELRFGTHQPAIWMGESGQVVVVPGAGRVQSQFHDRGMVFDKATEVITASYYSANLRTNSGDSILAEQSATSRVGHLRFSFTSTQAPYVLLEASRASVMGSADPNNVTYPLGSIYIDPEAKEITGTNAERQDFIIDPVSTPARGFKGYFCARFDKPFRSWGVVQNGTASEDSSATGPLLSGYATFGPNDSTINVRIGVSFISIDQARRNLDNEIPDGATLEDTAMTTRAAWAEKMDRIQLEGATKDEKVIFYTGFYHTLQYPYETSEDGKYYSGYDDAVHEGFSYSGYSIWDTFRAESAWLILFAPERVPGMITSMLQDYKEGGWLPMWKNIIETNIMVGTHADSLIAEAVVKGIAGFDLDLAWEAVLKDATIPPMNDSTTSYFDREENVDYEVRAGLSSVYDTKGWVASDIHSEAASRTLDYAYDDYAVYALAKALNKSSEAAFFLNRSLEAPFSIFNEATGFMEARNADGSWAGEDAGWTEGDKWAYSFDVVHDVPGLIAKRGGNASFVRSLEEHFNGGHNDHTNEPSHHIPYLYALAGAASQTQERVRSIAKSDYGTSPTGLAGNEDCGQMSAWWLFSALGFYPVNPVSGEYIVGSPFFEKVTIDLPGVETPLVITARGAPSEVYVASLSVNGAPVNEPIIFHEQIAHGGEIVFEMSAKPAPWAYNTVGVDTRTTPSVIHNEL